MKFMLGHAHLVDGAMSIMNILSVEITLFTVFDCFS